MQVETRLFPVLYYLALLSTPLQIGLPDTARKCAHTAQIDLETSGVGECAGLDASGKGAEGGEFVSDSPEAKLSILVRLLHKSVALGKTMGLEKSCTIYINGEKVCVHDETWKECEVRVTY